MMRRTALKTLGALRSGAQTSSWGATHWESSDVVFGASSNQQRSYGHVPLALKNQALKKGPGGRSSVSGVTATIFGATGFLGRYVCHALAKMGSQVVIPYRCCDTDMQHVRQMGALGQMVCLPDFDVRNEEQIRHAVSQSNVVINLIGEDIETWNFSFKDVHVDAARRIAKIAKETPSCERYIHISALGADPNAASKRLRTKAEGDQATLEEFPDATIMRPGYIVGMEDRFYNTIASLGKALPFIPLIDGGDTRVQPVYVRDVADAVVQALRTTDTKGKMYYLGGPEVITMRDAVDLVFDEMKEKRSTVFMPGAVAKMLVAPHTMLYKRLPIHFVSHFFTSDFINELSQDNVLPEGVLTMADLNMQPKPITDGIGTDHVRFWRAGGYDFGATAGTEV